jgi:hypothetical protein
MSHTFELYAHYGNSQPKYKILVTIVTIVIIFFIKMKCNNVTFKNNLKIIYTTII